MNGELEAMIKKALSEKEPTDKQEENKKPILTDEEIELVYKDADKDYEKPWQKIHNK